MNAKARVAEILASVKKEGRRELLEHEAKSVLTAWGIPVNRTELVRTKEEALEAANSIGYPVNVKICSPDILHKSDARGVKVGINSGEELKHAFDEIMENARAYRSDARILGVTVSEYVPPAREVIVGGMKDPTFGPTLMFGLGGVWVEVLRDVSFRVAPIDRVDAEEMIREIKGYPILEGVRGEPKADIDALVDILLKAGRLTYEFQEIEEMDINPIFTFEEGRGAKAVDARFILSST